VRLSVRAGDGVDEVLVVGRDRTGFLGAVAGTFAVHGIAVLAARLSTRSDGIAVDLFHVGDDRLGGSVPTERWDAVERDLAAVVAGDLDLSADLERRSLAYRHEGPEMSTTVSVRPAASARATVVEVRCADRIGRLAEIVAALYAENLDISRAALDIRAGEVIDTFHVRRHGAVIRDDDALVDLVTHLELALG
jgi:[protein-PII] uridylyltransferase